MTTERAKTVYAVHRVAEREDSIIEVDAGCRIRQHTFKLLLIADERKSARVRVMSYAYLRAMFMQEHAIVLAPMSEREWQKKLATIWEPHPAFDTGAQ